MEAAAVFSELVTLDLGEGGAGGDKVNVLRNVEGQLVLLGADEDVVLGVVGRFLLGCRTYRSRES